MRKSWLWDNAVTLATLVMAVTAIVALVYAHLQIVESRRAERETTRAYVVSLMKDAVLDIRVDPVGNIFGRRPGLRSAADALVWVAY